MEWIARQLCFALFVLLSGTVLRFGGAQAGAFLLRVLCPEDDSPFQQSKRIAVPVLLYAAVELFCAGEHAAVLLPVRMLSLLYGTALCVGLLSLLRLLRLCAHARAAAETAALLLTIAETTLLGYVLLRDGYCRGAAALYWGIGGMGAAVLTLLFFAKGQTARSAR